MNILVTGANGQLGNEMRIVAKGSKDNYIFTDVVEVEGQETTILDITNLDAVRSIVKENDIKVIVNCAAYTNVDAAESNEAIAEKVQRMGYMKEKITADAAEPKSIDRLRTLGLDHIRKARKGKDSIMNGIDYIQDFHIIIHPRCVNFLTEIGNYTWDVDSKTGKKINRPIDDFNHLMDAMRYALEDFSKGDAFSFE